MSSTSAPSLRPLWIVALVGGVMAADELLRCNEHAAAPELSPAQPAGKAANRGDAPCPSDTLPDHGVCIPVPKPETNVGDDTEATLQLLPGRPADYARYLTPLAGRTAAASSEGGVMVAAEIGTEVRATRLEAQIGPTRWAASSGGESTLLTLHRVERGGSARTYVLVYRGIDFNAPPAWQDIADGAVIGRVGATREPSGLRLGVRQLRRGARAEPAPTGLALRDSHSLACDPRNVLPVTPS